MKIPAAAAALFLALFIGGFRASPVAAAAQLSNCPNTGLTTRPVTFVTVKGRFAYTLEVAATPTQQQCGLMHRRAMPRRVGMDFPMDAPRTASFWMENTPLPLDLIFVGADARVVGIGKGVPFSRDLIHSGGIAARVIELNAGEADRMHLRVGDRAIG